MQKKCAMFFFILEKKIFPIFLNLKCRASVRKCLPKILPILSITSSHKVNIQIKYKISQFTFLIRLPLQVIYFS
jgi:hypothetical protein